jgi:DNA-binding GntR family transcriptional regulator
VARQRHPCGAHSIGAPCGLPGPNAALKQEIQDLWDRVWRARAASIFAVDPARMTQAQAEHRKIFAAVRRGDTDAAAAAMECHRVNTMASWQRVVANVGKTG